MSVLRLRPQVVAAVTIWATTVSLAALLAIELVTYESLAGTVEALVPIGHEREGALVRVEGQHVLVEPLFVAGDWSVGDTLDLVGDPDDPLGAIPAAEQRELMGMVGALGVLSLLAWWWVRRPPRDAAVAPQDAQPLTGPRWKRLLVRAWTVKDLVASLGVFVPVGAILYLAGRDVVRDVTAITTGRPTEGRVVARELGERVPGAQDLFTVVRFTAGGETHELRQRELDAPVGADVVVRFEPAAPEDAWVATWDALWPDLFTFLVMFGLLGSLALWRIQALVRDARGEFGPRRPPLPPG